MYRPGDVADATIHDLHGLAGWSLACSALVIATTAGELLLYVHDHDPDGAGMYAVGPLSRRLHGLTVEHPVVTGPHVGRIRLGRVTDHTPVPDGMQARARATLAVHLAARASSPLTAAALPLLDAACSAMHDSRAAATLATRARDRIVKRLLDGGVEPKAIERPGLSASRISQIKAAAPSTT